MGILSKIIDILTPVRDIVDSLHTSGEEKLELKASLLAIQAQVISEALAYEKVLAEAQSKVITAEAASESWVTRSWRPLVMLTFTALIVVGQFGGPPVPEQMWPLLTLGLGGYVAGRSIEKTVKVLKMKEDI